MGAASTTATTALDKRNSITMRAFEQVLSLFLIICLECIRDEERRRVCFMIL
jgi:hypothetical protein